MDNTKHRRLQELDRSNFEIIKGEPDIRGWDVRNGAGLKIGEVEELIIDAKRKKVRYMVVDLDDNELKLAHHKVLIPIGLAELHEKDDDVLLPSVTVDHLGALPAYDRDSLTEEVEGRVCNILGRDTNTTAHRIIKATEQHTPQPAQPTKATTKTPAPSASNETTHEDDEFYRHDYYNDDNLYKHRLHKPQKQQQPESEYEKGLRLWEMRSEGGVIPDDTARRRREQEVNEDAHMEMVRNRRRDYEERRGHHHRDSEASREVNRDEARETHRGRGRTIIEKLRDEGYQDGPDRP